MTHLRSVGAQAAGLHPAASGSVSSPSTVSYPLSTEVYTFQLTRSAGVGAQAASLRSTDLSAADRQLPSAEPFLGFTYIGPSNESDHLRDYAAEALAQSSPPARGGVDALRGRGGGSITDRVKRLDRRSSKEILVDGVLNGSYGRYIDGE